MKRGKKLKKKISTRIVAAIVFCSILISAIVGTSSILKSSIIIKKEAKDKLLDIASSRGNEYSIQTIKVENTVDELSGIILSSMDISKVKDNNYMSTYENQLVNLIKSLGDSNKGITGLYFSFDPQFTGGNNTYDIAYSYNDTKKKVILMLIHIHYKIIRKIMKN